MANTQIDAENTRLYAAAFNRTPDAAGLAYWDQAVDDGSTVPQIANFFAASPEFIQDYGALTDAGFVTQLYQNVLGRAPDLPGQAYWVADLASGDTRGDVLNFFAQSPENITHTAVVNATATAAAVTAAVISTPAVVASTPPPAVTPIPPPEPPVSAPLPDPVITGVQTINTPGAFVFTTAAQGDVSTLITTASNAEASNFAFSGLGGQVDLSDLQFNGFQFAPNDTSNPALSYAHGGKFVLTENDVAVGSITVLSSRVDPSTYTGIDQSTGYSFIHSG